MRTRKFYYFLVAILALNISIVACSGDDGGIGPDGSKGDQGIQGLVGPAGADGSVMYSGEGVPATETGIKGDYYCNSTTGMLYGPKKDDASWEGADSFSLKGENGNDGTNGTDGTNGSKILSGENIPAASIGKLGDYYLDKETYTLYGPKMLVLIGGNPWGAGLELKGADGNANVKSYIFSIHENIWILTSGKDKLYIYDDRIPLYNKLTDNILENGVVLMYRISTSDRAYLLPRSSKTSQGNLLTESFILGGQEQIYMDRVLFTYADATEELAKATFKYRAVIITGQTAVQLEANKDNQVEFDRLVGELAK